MGEQRSGGYSVKTSTIVETRKNITINVIESKPGSNCITTSVITYPFEIIEFDRGKTNKKFIFKTVENVYECKK